MIQKDSAVEMGRLVYVELDSLLLVLLECLLYSVFSREYAT